MDGLFLGFIARELDAALRGARVEKVQQPEKDELHIAFRGGNGPKKLLLSTSADRARVHLTEITKPQPQEPPMFCMLLRKLIGGAKVLCVRQVGGDRILEIVFACEDEFAQPSERILSCEVMGRHSNIILRSAEGKILDSIHHVGADISRVREVKPGLPYTPPPAQDKLDPLSPKLTEDALRAALRTGAARLDAAIGGALSGFGRESARELAYRLTGEESPVTDEEQRAALAKPLFEMLREMPSWGPATLLVNENGEAAEMYPFPQKRFSAKDQRPMPSASAAAEAYYCTRDARARLDSQRKSLEAVLRAKLEKCEKKLAIHEQALADDEKMEDARICGELLTANLHALQKGGDKAEVFDYYRGENRVIALDKRWTPSQNAQAYYKRYRKMRAAQEAALEQLDGLRAEQYQLESYIDDLRKCETPDDLAEVREALCREGIMRAVKQKGGKPRKIPASQPMRFCAADGTEILVGRSSVQNDRLTLSAPLNATWLHAKDIPGSHVIVNCEGEPSEEALDSAAMLAAYYSRAFRSAQVPVDITLRKYVKKPSGSPPGRVIYTHQRTVFVTPDEAEIKKLNAAPEETR